VEEKLKAETGEAEEEKAESWKKKLKC